MVKARVVFSSVGYIGDDGDRRQSAQAGQVVDLAQDEFDRLAALGAVTKFAGGGTASEPTDPADSQAAVKRAGNRAKPK